MKPHEYKRPTSGWELTDDEGNFKSNFEPNTLGYMEELIVWVGDHPSFSEEDRAYLRQEFEKPIIRGLKGMGIGYKPRYQQGLKKPKTLFTK